MIPSLTIEFMKHAQHEQGRALLARAFDNSAEILRSFNEAAADDTDYQFFVALDGDRVVGIVDCCRWPAEWYGHNIGCLAVDEARRREGIGHALVARAESHIAHEWLGDEPGYAFLYDATKKRDPSSRFYEKMGYRGYGDTEYEGDPMMVKPLNGTDYPPQAAPA